MSEKAAETVLIQGKQLTCPICSAIHFHHRTTMMNTRKLAVFNLEWLNKDADNYICDMCGHVLWFMKKE